MVCYCRIIYWVRNVHRINFLMKESWWMMTSHMLRKRKSEEQLQRLSVPVNKHLPYVEAEQYTEVRTKEEIVDRIIPLTIAAAKALGAPDDFLEETTEEFQAAALFTNEERQFMMAAILPEQAKINFSWKLECIWILMWSIDLVPELGMPDQTCDVDLVLEMILESSRTELLHKAELKPKSMILDGIDFIYRAHWAVRDAQLNGTEIPAVFDEGVVYERHYALNWLVHYMDQTWDEISTDT